MGIIANIGLDAISGSEANYRATRAAEQTVAALRYARLLAMSTGNSSGVEFNTALKTITVYTMINGTQTFVASPFTGSVGGNYQINLATNQQAVNGVAMAVSLPSDATNPYDCLYNALGATTNTGTINFTYSQGKRVVTIAAVADPTYN